MAPASIHLLRGPRAHLVQAPTASFATLSNLRSKLRHDPPLPSPPSRLPTSTHLSYPPTLHSHLSTIHPPSHPLSPPPSPPTIFSRHILPPAATYHEVSGPAPSRKHPRHLIRIITLQRFPKTVRSHHPATGQQRANPKQGTILSQKVHGCPLPSALQRAKGELAKLRPTKKSRGRPCCCGCLGSAAQVQALFRFRGI